MSFGVKTALKNKILARAFEHLFIYFSRPINAAGLAGLTFAHRHALLELCGLQGEHVADSQAADQTGAYGKAVLWH